MTDGTQAPAATRTAVLFTHSDPPGTDAAVRSAAEAAKRAEFALVAGADELAKHGEAASAVQRVDPLPESPELCLVLGGDGTILRALRAYAGTEVPVFGINFGTVGFLAAAEGTDLEAGLERAFGGEYEVMSLPGLEIDTAGRSGVAPQRRQLHPPAARQGGGALLPSRRAGGRSRAVRRPGRRDAGRIDGVQPRQPGADPRLGGKGYAVSFVAPHTLTARALVVAPDDVLHVRNAGERDPVDVALDGEPVQELASGEIEVRFRDGVGRLAQLKGSNFYRRIREKFGRLAH